MSVIVAERPEIDINTLVVPYRKPEWTMEGDDTRPGLRLRPAEMTIQRVVIKPTKMVESYSILREVAARCNVPPELVRSLVEDNRETVLCITTDPSMVIAEASLITLFERGIPCEVYEDPWSLFQVVAFDGGHSNGQLVRLAECGKVTEPEIDITGRAAFARFIDNAEDQDYSYAEREGRLLMSEGDYLRAEVDYRLHRKGQLLA